MIGALLIAGAALAVVLLSLLWRLVFPRVTYRGPRASWAGAVRSVDPVAPRGTVAERVKPCPWKYAR